MKIISLTIFLIILIPGLTYGAGEEYFGFKYSYLQVIKFPPESGSDMSAATLFRGIRSNIGSLDLEITTTLNNRKEFFDEFNETGKSRIYSLGAFYGIRLPIVAGKWDIRFRTGLSLIGIEVNLPGKENDMRNTKLSVPIGIGFVLNIGDHADLLLDYLNQRRIQSYSVGIQFR